MSTLHNFYFKLSDLDELKDSVETVASDELIEDLSKTCQTIKQSELAEKMGISEGYLSKIKNKQRKVNKEFLERYLKCKESLSLY